MYEIVKGYVNMHLKINGQSQDRSAHLGEGLESTGAI